ncbi:thioredoxin [Plantactinospora sp. KBS50]|uniref:thioredoxin n=1 Tax=Plantactinospora sp. KBS50 TaxID=2024580 RepID=UPI000BAB0E54|nr:thioredoxin [Plantactinospora sp. KBS50]ASW57190.1 thioredoxin [Plantactinospora sp. KBS50]
MTTTTTAGSVIACPACQKKNRVRPSARGTPRCGACAQPLPWLVDATDATLDAELRAGVQVLVDLWAPWCGPCRTMAPVLEQLARDRAGQLKIVKVNIDQNPVTADRYRAQSIPLLVLTRGGSELDRRTGALPSHQLRAWLDNQHNSNTRPPA